MERINQELEYETGLIVRLQTRIKQLETEKAELVKAVGLIDRCTQVLSANGIGKIESVVSKGLQLVYDDPTMGFIVEKKEGAKGISYRFLVRQGDTVGDPMDTFGGGVQNIAGFLLRVMLITRFKLARFMALDESFSNLGNAGEPPTLLENTSNLLQTMCSTYHFTILAVSHQPVLTAAADHVYAVVKGKPPKLRRVEGEELAQLRRAGWHEASQTEIA